MSALEHEILVHLQRLSEPQKQQVLEFVRSIDPPPSPARTYSARELMKLPYEERHRILLEQLALSANEDFEIFEAYSEEPFEDE